MGLGFRDFGAYIEKILPEDEALRKKIEDIGRTVKKKNLSMLASVDIFLKEIKSLSSQERARLKVIEQIANEIIHHDFCRKMLSSLESNGL